jgi:NAD(P)-dependent dehydrogenase (short-subunit alcohol dehydrogenase family)
VGHPWTPIGFHENGKFRNCAKYLDHEREGVKVRRRFTGSAPASIVNTASAAHQSQYLDFNDLQMEKHYRARTAYGRSKLANILFTREFARGLAGTGVTANCLHPGFVATGLGQRDSVIFGTVMRLSMLFAGSPEQGVRTIIHLAASPDVASTTGSYFVDCREAVPSRNGRDDGAARRL